MLTRVVREADGSTTQYHEHDCACSACTPVNGAFFPIANAVVSRIWPVTHHYKEPVAGDQGDPLMSPAETHAQNLVNQAHEWHRGDLFRALNLNMEQRSE